MSWKNVGRFVVVGGVSLGLGCGSEDPPHAASPADPSASAAPVLVAGPPESVYERTRRVEVQIEIDPADWDRLRFEGRSMADLQSPEPVDYVYTNFAADVTVDGVRHAGIEVKKKGFIGSLSVLRPSLRLDFQPDGTELTAGLRRLTLNGDLQDRSHVRQCMALDLFSRAGLPASRCGLAHVRVNGVDLGTYTNVEPIGKPMLRRHFADVDGNLYEGTLADFDAETSGRIEAENNESTNDRSDIAQLVAALDASDATLVAELERSIDVDQFRDFWAIETLIGHWDGYAETANNYYLYHDGASDRLIFLPWGLDQAFMGARPFSPDPYEISVYARARLARRLYDLPEQRQLFRSRLAELADQLWQESRLLEDAGLLASLAPDADARALEAHRAYLQDHGAELRAALELPAPEIVDRIEPEPPACPTPVGPIVGTLDSTWSGEGSFDVQLSLDGVPRQFEFSGAPGPDMDGGQSAVFAFTAFVENGRFLQLLLFTPRELVHPGVVPFHSFETFGLVAVIGLDGSFNTLGTIGDGVLALDEAGQTEAAPVRGQLDATFFPSGCLD